MFKLKIATPQNLIFEGEVESLSLNTDEGEQVILADHEPYISKVMLGELIYKHNNEIHPYAVSSGFLQVNKKEVKVLIDNAIHTKDIDIEKAEEAIMNAKEAMKDIKEEVDISKIRAKISLYNLHISTAKKYKHLHKRLPQE